MGNVMRKIAYWTIGLIFLVVCGAGYLAYRHHKTPNETIGSVSTGFNMVGPNHRIDVETMTDPLVPEVTCYVSMSRRGGIMGMMRDTFGITLFEEKNEKSIDCERTKSGPITLTEEAKKTREVARENRFMFNDMVVRFFYDQKKNTGVYIAYTDTLIIGSPKSSMSVISFE